MAELTGLLRQWCSGDRSVETDVFAAVYPLLHALAHKQVDRGAGHTLQPTELAHEAYLKLIEQRKVDWEDRGHFFAIAGRIVRQVVIDYLRERQALKRGGEDEKIPLDRLGDSDLPVVESDFDWLHLDRVLAELEAFDNDGARLVEQRYFAGLSVAAIAADRGVSEATIARQWRAVRAWLETRLRDSRA